jgi:hypothetical protein
VGRRESSGAAHASIYLKEKQAIDGMIMICEWSSIHFLDTGSVPASSPQHGLTETGTAAEREACFPCSLVCRAFRRTHFNRNIDFLVVDRASVTVGAQ